MVEETVCCLCEEPGDEAISRITKRLLRYACNDG